jgi:hypothetical protein
MPGAGAPPPGAGGATGAGGAGGAGGANGVGWARGAAGAAGAAGAGGAAGAAPDAPGGPFCSAAACPPADPGADDPPALGAPVPLGRTASVPPVADPNGTGGRMPGEPGEAIVAPETNPPELLAPESAEKSTAPSPLSVPNAPMPASPTSTAISVRSSSRSAAESLCVCVCVCRFPDRPDFSRPAVLACITASPRESLSAPRHRVMCRPHLRGSQSFGAERSAHFAASSGLMRRLR